VISSQKSRFCQYHDFGAFGNHQAENRDLDKIAILLREIAILEKTGGDLFFCLKIAILLFFTINLRLGFQILGARNGIFLLPLLMLFISISYHYLLVVNLQH